MTRTRTGPRDGRSGVAAQRDVEAIERRGPPALPASTYELIRRSAERDPDAPAPGRPDAYAGERPIAYVQPRRGAAVSEAQLLDFLGSAIGERAALPKRVHVVSEIPLSAVGMICKPELKRREAKERAPRLLPAMSETRRPAVVPS
jgi:fatty-acyl-CoA synthase